MGRITVNPAAEASATFDNIKPGQYRMRIQASGKMEAVKEFTAKSGNQCLRLCMVLVDPSGVSRPDGEPAKLVGSFIDNSLVITPADKQGKLRSAVEAAGLSWGDFDAEDLIGKELNVVVGLENGQDGTPRNVIKRYLK